ncbi:MAG: DUF1929 domain-containing protein [Armatimonadetes bacterium]|nr:DUF1929 domain-containing protein [Armatimonadota bacterium]
MGGSWEQIQDWPQELCAIQGVHLPSGKVLLWGVDRESGETIVRLWNPATNGFENVNNSAWIWCSGHTGLSDGLTLTAGGEKVGGGGAGNGIKEAYLFDESEDPPWRQVTDMFYERWYATTTTLPEGSALAISGTSDPDTPIENPEVYFAEAGKWVEHAQQQAKRKLPWYPFMFLIPNGKLAVTGRHARPGVSGLDLDTLTFDPRTQTWVTVDTNQVAGRDHASAATYEPGKVVRSGGRQSSGTNASDDTAVIDFTALSPQWSSNALMKMNYPRIDHTLVNLPDGSVLVVGGREDTTDDNPVRAAEIFEPGTKKWTEHASFSVAWDPRPHHSIGLLLADATVLVAGGQTSAGRIFSGTIFKPHYLDGSPTRPTISAPSDVKYGQQFQVTAAPGGGLSIDRITLVRLGAVTHGFDQNQRFLELTFQDAGAENVFDVDSPSDPNKAPPGYYMLFALNDDGVPSVAEYVRVWDGLIRLYSEVDAVWQGTLQSGDSYDLLLSDNSYMVIGADFDPPQGEPNAGLEVRRVAPEGSFSELRFRVESSTTTSVTQRISLYNYDGDQWEQVDERNSSVQDGVVEVTITNNPGRFIGDPQSEIGMKARRLVRCGPSHRLAGQY